MAYFSEALLGRLTRALLLTWLLCTLQAQAQIIQVRRNGETINILQQTEYWAFQGDRITFTCLCSSSQGITSVKWMHNGNELASQDNCLTPLTYQLEDISSSNSGEHICKTNGANGKQESSAGTLTVLDPAIVQAPPVQYGILGMPISLTCSTTLEDNSGVSISWFSDEQATNAISVTNFERTDLHNEGMYYCRVFLGSYGLTTMKKINFSVIIPPTITQKPSPSNHLFGNQAARFPVQFQSRFQYNTTIVWYKDDNSAVSSELWTTYYIDEANITTELVFENLRRADAGLYRVAILNTSPSLPANLRQVEANFTLAVTVFPVPPSNVMHDVKLPQSKLSWELANQNEDDHPDSVTVRLYFANNTMASQHIVDGTQTELNLNIFPGLQYRLELFSSNVDGHSDVITRTFSSPNGEPSTPNVQLVRHSDNQFNITVSLSYIGTDRLTQLSVSYKQVLRDAVFPEEFLVDVVPTGNVLEWQAVVRNERGFKPGTEFSIKAVNDRGFASAQAVQLEPTELPGRPGKPVHLSSTYNSLLIQVPLSPDGASPVIALDVVFLNYPNLNQTIYGEYTAGGLIETTVGGLNENTVYQFTVTAINYGGRGEPSPITEAATEKRPPVPLYGIVLISSGTAIAIILFVVIVILIARHIYNVQRAKRQYKFSSGHSSDAVKTLGQPIQPSLASGTKRSLPPPPLIAQSSRSSENGHPGSQSTYSRQGSTSTYPLSPQRTISTSDGGSPTEQFQFERQGSISTSNDSESEINYPRYTYKVSPSPTNMATPQLGAHSLHSMHSYPSTMTRLTTSSGSSARESLILSPTEFNATNV